MSQLPLDIISININHADVNYHIAPHAHNFWQLYYVQSGDVEMTIENKKHRMGQGDGILIPPGATRYPRCVGKAPIYMFVFFHNISFDLENIAQIVLHANAQQQVRFRDIYNEMENPKDRNAQAFMNCSLVSLLIELRRNIGQDQPGSKEHYHEIVSRLDTFMRSNLQLPLLRKDLARVVHVSQPHLARIFQKVMNMTPLERLTQLRMQHAQLLLRHSSLSITDISADVGYDSISHFSRTFKKYTGQTPREFRNDHIPLAQHVDF